MTQLIALSFDCPTAPSIRLKAIDDVGESLDATYGWGFAWYSTDEHAATVIKDPTAIGDNPLSSVLSQWNRFSSTSFLTHLRGAAKRRAQKDTHPFSRCWAGRDWIFTHNGDLRHGFREVLTLPDDAVFEPIGSTDSEHAFCWLLEKIRSVGARRLRDVDPDRFHAWLHKINELGTANILLGDGLDIVAYSDAFGYRPLWWTRRHPPDSTIRFENDEVAMRLGSRVDLNRCFVVVSTVPLSEAGWSLIENGAMLRISRGEVLDHRRIHGETLSMAVPAEPEVAREAASALEKASSTLHAPEVMDAGLDREPESRQPTAPSPDRLFETVHETVFRYDEAVESSWHMFRLQPVHDALQQLVDYQLDISPPGPLRTFDDVFGNRTVETELTKSYRELTIVARSTVRLHGMNQQMLRSALHPERLPMVWMPWQRQMMLPYRNRSA